MGEITHMAKRYRLKEKHTISQSIHNKKSRPKNKTILNKQGSIIQNNSIQEKIKEYYETYYERILIVVSNTIANKCNIPLSAAKEAGKEVASDAFVVLCQKYATINENYIYSWLYKVAENLANNFVRKFFTEMRHVNVSINDESQCESVRNISIDSDEYNIEDVKNRFLDSLTPEERNEYELYFCTDKSLKEIAEECDMEYITARKHKSRLLAKLKKKLLDLLYIF